MPVLESGLDRSIALAAAMDSRGYGRTNVSTVGSHRSRRLTAVLLLGGLLCVAMATYALLDASTPPWMGLPLLAIGLLAAGAGVITAGRRSVRSRYRPDPWRRPEWLVALSAVPGFVAIVISPAAVVNPSVDPAVLPSITLLFVAAIAVALTPAWTAPDLPFSFDPRNRRTRVDTASQARDNKPALVGGAL
jgi:energy-coupling factor transport system permease protein